MQYDFMDRLTGAPGWLAYGYNSVGNRTSETVDGVSATFAYGSDPDRVKQRSTPNSKNPPYSDYVGFGYDYQGNVSGVAQTNLGGDWVQNGICLRHDALGRLVMTGEVAPAYLQYQYFGDRTHLGFSPVCTQDSHVATVTARFRYDSSNRRIARWSVETNEWTHFISDGSGRILSEVRLAVTPTPHWVSVRDYVWVDDEPVAQIEYPGPSGGSPGYTYFFHLDHIGLPRVLTNAAGQMVWNTIARPFGDVQEKTAVDPGSGRVVVTNLRLPGQYDERLLASVGFQGPYYNWNRWYLPGVGRYLELDPIALRGGMNGPHGPDWYNYAKANPLGFTDPTGLYSEVCWRKVLGPVGATGAQHCFLRVGGPSGETESYYATLPVDPFFKKVGPDLNSKNPTACHPITPPDDPATCTDRRTPFDQCLEMAMLSCASCTYSIKSNNCCHCVARAIAQCGGTYTGPWPNNYGWGPK